MEISIHEPGFQRMRKFKDMHQGRRGFIVGNGPSLTSEDLDLLEREITFAANKIYLYFNNTQFRPDYYAAVDLIFLENFHTEVMDLDVTTFLPVIALKWIKPSDRIYIFKEFGHSPNQEFMPGFSSDICKGLYGGYTISFSLIQLAFYMGIRELYLIGMDHEYCLPAQRTYHHAYGEVLVSDGQKNHFHPNYRPNGELWSIPRLDYQEKAFKLALDMFKNNGGIIRNATRGGKLDIFPRCKLEDVLT